MSGDTPHWVSERAYDLASRHGSPMAALRALIVEHEEASVNPLLVEAREIVARTQHNWPDSPWHIEQAALCRAGRQDCYLTVMAAYEGLKRGMELAKGEAR